MAKISITFVEEGQTPVNLEISEATAAMLDQFVIDTTSTDAEGNPVPQYAGKADLFFKHTVNSLLKPLADKYQATIGNVADLEAQKALLENAITMAKMQAIMPTMVTPEAPVEPVVPPTE